MSDLDVVITVELKLSDPETGRGALGVGDWKPYPHGWSAPKDTSISAGMKAAWIEDMEVILIEESFIFVRNQYDSGEPPLGWRIKKGTKMIAHGTDRPEDAA